MRPAPLIIQLRKSRFSFERHFEKRILVVLEPSSRIPRNFLQDAELKDALKNNQDPYHIASKNIKDYHDYFLKWSNIEWKIGKITMENHEVLYFQLAFLETFSRPLIQIRIQDNTTMAFQQNIYSSSITDEI